MVRILVLADHALVGVQVLDHIRAALAPGVDLYSHPLAVLVDVALVGPGVAGLSGLGNQPGLPEPVPVAKEHEVEAAVAAAVQALALLASRGVEEDLLVRPSVGSGELLGADSALAIEAHQQVGPAVEIAVPGLAGEPPAIAPAAGVVAPGVHPAVAVGVLFLGDHVAVLVEPTGDLDAARLLAGRGGAADLDPARDALAKVHDKIGAAVAAAVLFPAQDLAALVVKNPDIRSAVAVLIALAAPMHPVLEEEHRIEAPIAAGVLFDAHGHGFAARCRTGCRAWCRAW